MPPLSSGLTRESPKKVMTRQNTPTPEMPQAVRMAAPLAPCAAWSPAKVNTPPPMMSVMTVVTRRKSPRPPCAWGTRPSEGAPSSCKAGARRREDASVGGAVGSGRCGERALITSPYFCRNCLPHDAWRDARPRFLLRASGETTPMIEPRPQTEMSQKDLFGKLKTCRMSPHAASRAGISCARLRLRLHTHGIPCTVSATSRRVPKASQASAPPA